MRTFLKKLGIAGAWLLVWQLASAIVGSNLLLPSPYVTLMSLVKLAGTRLFYQSIGMTLLRVSSGFALGMLAGTLLGALSAASDWANAFLSPLKGVIKATPVTSFIILVLLWLSDSMTSMFSAFLMVMPIAWVNVYEGIRGTDRQLLEMARVYEFSKMGQLRYIYIFSVLPAFLAACAAGLGFAWKSGVAAEVIAMPKLSIGRRLYESKIYLEVPELFAWTASVILLSMALEAIMLRAIGRIGDRRQEKVRYVAQKSGTTPAGGSMAFEHVSFAYGDRPVLTDLSFEFPQNGVVAALGPSGGGKTTLLRLLAGLIKPDTGSIKGIERKKIAYMFQEDRLLPWLTARQNIALVAEGGEEQVEGLLADMKLLESADNLPRELSGGMQRRVALARALARGGDVLLLDEPFKGLDDALKRQVARAVRERFTGLIVISTHDYTEAELLGSVDGKIML